jgi:hypothetical protein
MRYLRILFPLVLLGVASCSGSEKPSPALSSLRASSASTSMSVVAATSSTVASPAVAVPSSTTSTTAAKKLEAVVAEAAVQNWMVDREGCYLAIDSCDPTSFTPDGSNFREQVTKLVADYRAANFKLRANTDDPSYIVVKSVVLGADRTTADVTTCYWSTAIVYEPNEKAVGREIISNDKKSSRDMELTMGLFGKRWLIKDYRNVTKYEGFNTCPAK